MTPFALHLLRHGAPVLPDRMMGRTDVAPTMEGIAECCERVRDVSFQRAIASDLRRAQAAGQAIAVARGVDLALDGRWRELDFGDWDGLPAETIDRAALARFWDDPDANPPPAGERWSALVARVTAAIATLEPVDTLIVSHGGAIRAALHVLCGFERRHLWAFDLPCAALVSLRIWPGQQPAAQITGLRS